MHSEVHKKVPPARTLVDRGTKKGGESDVKGKKEGYTSRFLSFMGGYEGKFDS